MADTVEMNEVIVVGTFNPEALERLWQHIMDWHLQQLAEQAAAEQVEREEADTAVAQTPDEVGVSPA